MIGETFVKMVNENNNNNNSKNNKNNDYNNNDKILNLFKVLAASSKSLNICKFPHRTLVCTEDGKQPIRCVKLIGF